MQYFPSPNGTNIGYGQSFYRQSCSFTGDKLHLSYISFGVEVRDDSNIPSNDTPTRNISHDRNGIQLVYHILLQPGFYSG